MANARFYSSTALETQLNGGINGAATTITLAANTGFPGTLPFTLALDYGAANEELVDVTAGNNPYTITRAVDGTAATSHNTGAVVRHVSSARDFTESRTHEAAITGIHGVTGPLAGTTDAQTLTNKTLTSPTINSGALAGTFTGTPTFSGSLSMTAGISVSGGSGTFSRTLSTNPAVNAQVTGDTNARLAVEAGGRLMWGPGDATQDTTLYRSGTNTLATDDQFVANRPLGTDVTFAGRQAADSNARWYISADGAINWGDGAGVFDTNLYRSAANTLKTDDSLVVTGTLSDSATTIRYRPTQTGTETVNFAAVTQVDAAVVFPVAFTSAPVVIVSKQNSPAGSAKIFASATGVTTTGFTMRFNTGDGTAATTTGLIGGYHAS